MEKEHATELFVGAALREARTARGRSQEWVALRADVDRSYLSQIENDHQSPTVEMLSRLCSALDMRVSALIMAAEGGSD